MEFNVIKQGDAKLEKSFILDSTDKIAVIGLLFWPDDCYVYGIGNKTYPDNKTPVVSIARKNRKDVILTDIEFKQFSEYEILSYSKDDHWIYITLINWMKIN